MELHPSFCGNNHQSPVALIVGSLASSEAMILRSRLRYAERGTVGIPSRGIIISYVERATISADLVNTRAKRETAAAEAALVALRDYARNHISMPPLRFNGAAAASDEFTEHESKFTEHESVRNSESRKMKLI